MQHPISNEAQLKVKLHKAFNSALLTRFAYQINQVCISSTVQINYWLSRNFPSAPKTYAWYIWTRSTRGLLLKVIATKLKKITATRRSDRCRWPIGQLTNTKNANDQKLLLCGKAFVCEWKWNGRERLIVLFHYKPFKPFDYKYVSL